MIQFNRPFGTGGFQKYKRNLNPTMAFWEQFKMGQNIAAELAKFAVLFGWQLKNTSIKEFFPILKIYP